MIILCQLQLLSLALGTKRVPNCCARRYWRQHLAPSDGPSASGEDWGGHRRVEVLELLLWIRPLIPQPISNAGFRGRCRNPQAAQLESAALRNLFLIPLREGFLPRSRRLSWGSSHYSQKCLILSKFLMSSCPRDHVKGIYSSILCIVKRHSLLFLSRLPFTFFPNPSLLVSENMYRTMQHTFSVIYFFETFLLNQSPSFQLLFSIFECCRDLDQI